MSLSSCRILELPKITDRRGSLTFAEGGRHVPFDVKRIFYLFDVPAGETRAAHALRTCQQVIVAISGNFDVSVDDGKAKKRFHLDRPDCGLYVPPLIWREIAGFSPKAVCMVLASEFYDEADYVDDYAAFTAAVGAQKK
jgi:dTDP-4-dehydrorhamnose 3,5-epimerase-like enzyme